MKFYDRIIELETLARIEQHETKLSVQNFSNGIYIIRLGISKFV